MCKGFTFPNFAPRTTPLSDEEAFAAMKAAIDGGATFWNGGAYYGFGANGELLNLELIARFFTKYPELADKVFLSVKGAFNVRKMGPDGSPEFLRADVDAILKALNGKKKLDLYEMGRVDRTRLR
jgi:pyridoxine 4-dehydrogenase